MARQHPRLRRKAVLSATAIAVAMGLAVSGCSTAGGTASTASRETADCTAKTSAAIAEYTSGQTTSVSQDGTAATSATELSLTADDIASLKEMAPTVAIFMHRTDDDAARGFVSGAEQAIKDYGLNLVSTSVANSDVAKQVADLETILVQGVDGIIAIPLDKSGTAAAFSAVSASGTKVVFTDYATDGLTAGEGYVTIVSNDDRNNGRIDGLLLARGIGCTGEVALIPYADHGWFSNFERWEGVKEVLADYPDITIVEETEIAGPDFAGDGEKAASAFLTKYPNLAGIWSFWATPGSGVVQAVKQSGRTDVITVTNDLTEPAGLDILDGDIYGLASGRFYEEGYAEITALAMSLLGKDVPPYVVLPAYAVDKTNVLDAYSDIYGVEPPQTLIDADAAQ